MMAMNTITIIVMMFMVLPSFLLSLAISMLKEACGFCCEMDTVENVDDALMSTDVLSIANGTASDVAATD